MDLSERESARGEKEREAQQLFNKVMMELNNVVSSQK